MTELMTRVLNAIPQNEAVSAEWIARHTISAETNSEKYPFCVAVVTALHHLQDADLVYLRNGFYRLSESAKAARQREAADPPLPDCVVQGDDDHWMVDR